MIGRMKFSLLRWLLRWAGLVLAAVTAIGAESARPDYIEHDAPVIALMGVRVIDGSGAPAMADQTIVIAEGKIAAIGSASATRVPADAKIIELKGKTVTPGLVMLHEHLMYFSGRAIWHSQPVSYPRLYLAAGVTTLRTAGTEQPEVDLNLKRRIDSGKAPGPKMHLTSPFLNGAASDFLGDTVVRDAEEARRSVVYFAERGFTSFKVYSAITSDALRAVVEEAHRRRLTVAGHLESVSCAEAADLGIDSIEHSFNSCMKDLGIEAGDEKFVADVNAPKIQELIKHLVRKGVTLVATPVSLDEPLSETELDLLHPQSRETYLRNIRQPPPWWPRSKLEREIRKLERAFVAAGGRLGLGADPADFGQIAGYADHRALHLLSEAGWTPAEIIRLATSQNADVLGVGDSVGRIAVGHAADLIVVSGDPLADVRELAKADLVFKDGVAYDPTKLRAPAKGLVGWQ